jgi:hypothetical protein
MEQIRLYCIHSCMNHQPNEVLKCPSTNCLFFDMRFGKNRTNPRKRASKQIKLYCIDCSDGTKKVKNCNFKKCELFTFHKTRKIDFSTPTLHNMLDSEIRNEK